MENEISDICDELVDEVIVVESRYNKADAAMGRTKHPYLDTIQCVLEEEVLQFCVEEGMQPYLVVINALNYLVDGHKFEEKYPNYALSKFKGRDTNQITELSTKLGQRLEDSFLKMVSEYELFGNCPIKGPEARTVIGQIVHRYSSDAVFGDRGVRTHNQEEHDNSKHPLEVRWRPWFKGLDEKYQKALDYFNGEYKGLFEF